jgi:hypothetical protein
MSEDQKEQANVSREDIEARAYQFYLARGEGLHGYDAEDWLRAEEELRAHPITTAAQEAEVRGAEAEAVEEKREAEGAP